MIQKSAAWFTSLTLAFGTVSLLTPESHAAETEAVAKSPAKVYTSAETAEFSKLAKATLETLMAGKQAEAITLLTDLETAWDDKEDALKPKNEATWTILDKTLDKAISSLRSSHINLEKGKAALEKLIQQLNDASNA